MKKLIAIVLLASTLQGCVGVLVAGAATSTAVIATDPRSTKRQTQDQQIEFNITGLTAKAPYQNKARVTSVSYNGTVYLFGQTVHQNLSQQVERQVRGMDHVNIVHNQIRNTKPVSIAQISQDSWITTKIKSKFLANEELKSIKIKVVTEDQEVFLIGDITAPQSKIAIEITRNVDGVKQVINAFTIIQ
ncbi:BON domain-containing protein [Vibrio sp. SS-MA-C1-2]|uniref:BON domain-containing protein n=1 Tax=Vibrio sp. SS-MA-C1-2 TaxID=2908646 RepID=UPI001F2C1B8B|nr:BON domain-containing protein [Vibrio sp. SS-MA-C1-2]UJF19083.1 BON domain-containing protein [Vibrio sp. SS-MA-C1-2]